MTKPTVGIFSLTCCEGCQIEILDLEDVLLDVVDKIDILSFRLAKAEDINQEFDIVFLEGSVSTKEDLEKTKKLRERAKTLVALGTCACTGGVQAIKNFKVRREVENAVYKGAKQDVEPVDPVGIGDVVDVDLEIKGCPIDNSEFVEILKQLLLGVKPYQREWPVCVECRMNQNPCLLDQGKICLGPLTYSGCDSVCTNNRLPCIGCRGIMHDSNIKAFVKELKERKHTMPDIKRALQTIYGKNERLKL